MKRLALTHKTAYALAMGIFFYGCASGTNTATTNTLANTTTEKAEIKGEPCNVSLGNVHFTKSINDASQLATVTAGDKLEFKVGAQKDYFADPDEKLSNSTAPILLTEIDNEKPFTFMAKVTPTFTKQGLYNAGVLFIYGHERLYQKFCFEQDEHGATRVVTVRTNGTSDDNNHEAINQPFVFMKISSDGKTVGSYFSANGKNWKLARLYKNEYPKKLWVGLSSQCPVDTGSVSYFEQVSLEKKSVADFRLGI